MAFPTFESAAVVSATDLTYTGNPHDVSGVTITAAKTLLVLWSDLSLVVGGGTNGSVVWDPAGANQTLTPCGNWFSGPGWGAGRIFRLDNPTPGASKVVRFSGGTASQQFAYAICVISEAVSQIAYNGAGSSTPPATDPYDVSSAALSVASGDALFSLFSTDDGIGNGVNSAPTCTGATSIAARSTGGGDSWSVFDYRVVGGTSEVATYHVVGDAGGTQNYAIAAVALRNASVGGGSLAYLYHQPKTLLFID